MKAQRTLLLIALFASCNVMAQQQTEQPTNISSAVAISSIGDLKIHWLAPSKPADGWESQEPVAGLRPQAWTTIVGWHPGQSAFPDGGNFSTEMPLLWIGHEPWE
jgi:hypothetical protein